MAIVYYDLREYIEELGLHAGCHSQHFAIIQRALLLDSTKIQYFHLYDYSYLILEARRLVEIDKKHKQEMLDKITTR